MSVQCTVCVADGQSFLWSQVLGRSISPSVDRSAASCESMPRTRHRPSPSASPSSAICVYSSLKEAAAEGGKCSGDEASAQRLFKNLSTSSDQAFWQRLRHPFRFAMQFARAQQQQQRGSPRVADVGCDHGVLAISLAVSGGFSRVLATDLSSNALQSGCAANLAKVRNYRLKKGPSCDTERDVTASLELRVGEGLRCIHPGEVDVVCICGMGAHTMLGILLEPAGERLLLDQIGVQRLVLQPTNSRPRNMVALYSDLQRFGWGLSQEAIEMVAGRWYITAAFTKRFSSSNATANGPSASGGGARATYPGECLAVLEQGVPMLEVYKDYVRHHVRWLERDLANNPTPALTDVQWLKKVKASGIVGDTNDPSSVV